MKAHKGRPRIALLFPFIQEAKWAAQPGWMEAENLAPTVIRSPAHPARSKYKKGLSSWQNPYKM
jgi:hypothetical protein